MKRSTILLAISSLISHISYLSPAALPSVEMLPFTFAGRIVDYAHVAYDADTTVEIRVKAKDGTLLAKTTTATSGLSAYNYVIAVPVASQVAAGYVKVGDEVDFEFVDQDGVIYTGLVPPETAMVGGPGQSAKVDVILATDSDEDGIPDEYVETLEDMLWQYGVEAYDALADYDGDGVSNYAEYVAGTDPFDKTDKFSVREMVVDQGDYVAFKVLVSQGRTYTVSTTDSLGKTAAEWTSATFSVDDPTAERLQRFSLSTVPAEDETGYRVIYVKKEGANRFWQMKVE